MELSNNAHIHKIKTINVIMETEAYKSGKITKNDYRALMRLFYGSLLDIIKNSNSNVKFGKDIMLHPINKYWLLNVERFKVIRDQQRQKEQENWIKC